MTDAFELPVTLVQALVQRATLTPERVALRFLAEDARDQAVLSYRELDLRARGIAAALQARTVPGDRAILLFPSGPDYVAAFFGCLYAGVIAVTAVDTTQKVYRYANRGAYVDFSARGVGVAAIDTKGDVRDATGTSFAAPVIAARLAAQLRTPDAAAAQRAVKALEKEARDLGPPGRDPVYGAGLVGGIN